MKWSKSTRILVNVVLILVIAILIKSLVTAPRILRASPIPEYLAVPYRTDIFVPTAQTGSLTNFLNVKAREGWRLHSVLDNRIIFERRLK